MLKNDLLLELTLLRACMQMKGLGSWSVMWALDGASATLDKGRIVYYCRQSTEQPAPAIDTDLACMHARRNQDRVAHQR